MKHGGDIYSETIEYDFSVNLNPYDVSEIIEKILDDSVKNICNYPDTMQRQFRKAVALSEGIDKTQVLGGNGSSELIMAIVSMINPKKVMLITPCFSGYYHTLLRLKSCEKLEYSLKEEDVFLLDEGFIEYLKKEAEKGLDLLFLTNPNNPNGRLISKNILISILNICMEYGVKIIVDECFIRMTDNGYSMVSHINEYDGLFVVNAYTKLFSIPGIRAGYVMTDKRNVDELKYYLPEWNMSVIAQSAGIICSEYLQDDDFLSKTMALIDKEREYLSGKLDSMGFKIFKSDTAFILVKTTEKIYEYLLKKGILIRECSDYKGLGTDYLRIAVRKHSDNEVLVRALEDR